MSKYQTAGKGIYFLFTGEILALLAFIPLLGAAAVIAGGLLSIFGLYTMSKADEGYKQALVLTVAKGALNIAASFFSSGTGFLSFVVSIVMILINAVVIYQICNTTGMFLSGIDSQIARQGETIWKTVFFCSVVEVLCSILAVVPVINILALVAAVIVGIVQCIIGILYLVFLYRSQKVLKNCGM